MRQAKRGVTSSVVVELALKFNPVLDVHIEIVIVVEGCSVEGDRQPRSYRRRHGTGLAKAIFQVSRGLPALSLEAEVAPLVVPFACLARAARWRHSIDYPSKFPAHRGHL